MPKMTITNVNMGGTFNLNYEDPPGQNQYTTSGTYSWVAPEGVRSIDVLCIGGGGGGWRARRGAGGGGGGLVWVNEVVVTPYQTYTVTVGAGGAIQGSAGGNS